MKTTLLLATCFANYIALWIDNFDTNIDIDSIERIMFSSFGVRMLQQSRGRVYGQEDTTSQSAVRCVPTWWTRDRERGRKKEKVANLIGRIETLTSSSQGNSQRCH